MISLEKFGIMALVAILVGTVGGFIYKISNYQETIATQQEAIALYQRENNALAISLEMLKMQKEKNEAVLNEREKKAEELNKNIKVLETKLRNAMKDVKEVDIDDSLPLDVGESLRMRYETASGGICTKDNKGTSTCSIGTD